MNSRERLLTALDHREPDRIPYDLGSTQVTGIHVIAHRRLREYLGLPEIVPTLCDSIQQLAMPEEDLIERLGVDIRGLYPRGSHNWNIRDEDAGDDWEYRDEWGIVHRRPKSDGLYYTVVRSPLSDSSLTEEEVRAYPFPDTGDPARIAGLRTLAESYRAQGQAVMLKALTTGIFEMAQRIRGMDSLLMDLVSNEPLAGALLDRLLELKLAFWETALPALGDVLDVVMEGDDYGTQVSQLISPRTFRQLFKPRLAELFSGIRRLAPGVKLFFHSCGNVRPLVPDFIELGVDILNPVHIAAKGMEPAALKRDFGKDIVFWGGGVDTQDVLPYGTPQQVRDHVRRNIEILAPGGGFVFTTIHNIQADVPPENVLAMWEALRS